MIECVSVGVKMSAVGFVVTGTFVAACVRVSMAVVPILHPVVPMAFSTT